MLRALKLEKTMMAILLSLIIDMGAFNLVSSQVMLVTDKQADIAILRTLGLTPRGVMQVFMVQGSLIGRSEEHTSELQSLMRISYAVFCLKNTNTKENIDNTA